MARYYAAVLENDDGTPARVEHAASQSEVTAARAALRLANAERRNALVVERSTINTELQNITQRIRYFGGRSAGLAVTLTHGDDNAKA